MLRELRIKRLCTLAEVARAVDVSSAFLSDIESERRQPPAYNMIESMLDFLEVTDKKRGPYYKAALEERCAVCKYRCSIGGKDYGKKKKD